MANNATTTRRRLHANNKRNKHSTPWASARVDRDSRRVVIARSSNAPTPDESRSDLWSALTDAVSNQRWVGEVLAPWMEGPPRPVVDTVPRRALADLDAHFADVEGIDVHYKARFPLRGDARDGTSTVTAGTMAETQWAGERDNDLVYVVCFHGFNGSEFSFRHLLPAIADDERFNAAGVAFDRPPFGLTERPRPGNEEAESLYSVPGSSRLAQGLLRHIDGSHADTGRSGGQGPTTADASAHHTRRRVVLVGHSAGAPCAVRTALDLADSPDFDVAGVVLVAPALNLAGSGGAGDDPKNTSALPSKLDAGQLLRFAYARALLAVPGVNANFVRRSLNERRERAWRDRDIYSESAGQTPMDVVLGYTKPLAADGWDTGALPYFRNTDFTSAESNPDPAQLPARTPILVVHGSEDGTVAPSVGRGVVERLRANGFDDATYEELSGIGHLPMETHPTPFHAVVLPFLRRIL